MEETGFTAVAEEHLSMNEMTGRRIDFEQFKVLCRAITTYDDPDVLMKHVVEHICRSLRVKASSIFLYDDREKQIFRVASCCISESYILKGPLPLDVEKSELARGEPIFIDDVRTDARVVYPEAAEQEGFVSMLSVPIRHRREVLGVIRFYLGERWSLHEEDLDSFCLLGEQLGLAVENTGLKNFLDQVKLAMGSLPLRMLKGL